MCVVLGCLLFFGVVYACVSDLERAVLLGNTEIAKDLLEATAVGIEFPSYFSATVCFKKLDSGGGLFICGEECKETRFDEDDNHNRKWHGAADPNVTLLGYAVRTGNDEMVKVLLRHGAKANDVLHGWDDAFNATALSWARTAFMAQQLLQSKYGPPDEKGRLAAFWHYATWGENVEVAQILLDDYGQDICQIGETSMLHHAQFAFKGSLFFLRTVSERCFRGENVTRLNCVILKSAISGNHPSIWKHMMQNGFACDAGFGFLLEDVATYRREELVKVLAPCASLEQKNSALLLSIMNVELGMVKTLLEHGADPNVRDSYCRTGIMWAALRGTEWYDGKWMTMIDLFLSFGADINSQIDDCPETWLVGESALTLSLSPHLALHSDHLEVARFLISRGARLTFTAWYRLVQIFLFH